MTQAQEPQATAGTASVDERSHRAAAIAGTVGAVLAHTAGAATPHTPADAAEIRAITDAMVRLFIGAPLRSDGQLTVKSLAEEAGLRRNKLTHKHTGLRHGSCSSGQGWSWRACRCWWQARAMA